MRRNTNWIVVLLAGLLFFTIAASGCGGTSSAETVKVYRSPTCGCCGKWIDYLAANGFTVETIELPDVKPIKTDNGVPPELASCHTALVGGYIVEGHVPAAQIVRLLAEKPVVLGISAPGMPVGSPGMESNNPSQHQDYNIVSFDGSGKTELFARIEATR